jgi:hypothetical protein
MTKRNFVLIILSLFFVYPNLAIASPAGDALGACMVDSLTGKERKQLAQWVFFAMAAHPEIREYSKVTPASEKSINEIIGKLVTRLLTVNCAKQAKAAAKEEGSTAIKGAFELVGAVAMQELMSNKDVTASISGYIKYIDDEKISAILKDK